MDRDGSSRAGREPKEIDRTFFSPNVKVSYNFTKEIAGGVEYYASYGGFSGFDSLHDQAAANLSIDRSECVAAVGD